MIEGIDLLCQVILNNIFNDILIHNTYSFNTIMF